MSNKTKTKTKEVTPKLEVIEQPSISPKDDVLTLPIPQSIHHSGAKEKVSWNIIYKDAQKLRVLTRELEEQVTIDHSIAVSEWIGREKKDAKGRPTPMPRRGGDEITRAELERIVVHLGVEALELLINEKLPLPARR